MIAHVERKSAALLSGRSEASYWHFFIGQVSGSSRSRFHCLSTSLKNCHSEASRHSGRGVDADINIDVDMDVDKGGRCYGNCIS